MKHITSIILSIAFISIAVFGFLGIGSQGCIATMAASGVCPVSTSTTGGAFFHSQMYKSFSSGILAVVISVAVFFVAIAVMTIDVLTRLRSQNIMPTLYQKLFSKILIKIDLKLRRCLTRYQKQDAAILA